MIESKIRWVPLKFDLMAKKIFGDSEDKKAIKFLLNQILGINPKEVTVLNTEIIDKPYKDKKFEVDLLVVVEDDTIIGVEINTDVSKAITNRNLFYMCRIMSRDLKPNESFNNLHKHIQISFDFKGKEEIPIMSYRLINKETGKILSDKMEIVKVNVPYFYRICYNKSATLQERFIGLLNEEDGNKAKLLIRGDKNMEDLYDKIVENSDEEIIGLYDLESHRREVERSVMEEAVEQGHAQGLAQGHAQGHAQGLEEGLEQGIKQEKENITRNMLKEGFDLDLIAKLTGLSTEEISKFK